MERNEILRNIEKKELEMNIKEAELALYDLEESK